MGGYSRFFRQLKQNRPVGMPKNNTVKAQRTLLAARGIPVRVRYLEPPLGLRFFWRTSASLVLSPFPPIPPAGGLQLVYLPRPQ